MPADLAMSRRNYGATAAGIGLSMQGQYDDDPGMEGYSDDFDEDVFPGDEDFVPEDLVASELRRNGRCQPRQSGRKGLVAAIVVLGVAALGGGGFYLWNGGLGGDACPGRTIGDCRGQ